MVFWTSQKVVEVSPVQKVWNEVQAHSLALLAEATRHNGKVLAWVFATLSSSAASDMLGGKQKLLMQQSALQSFCEESPLQYFAILWFTLFVIFKLTMTFFRRSRGKAIPAVQGGWPFIGQVFTMIKGSPWDTMAAWTKEYGGIYSFLLFGEESISVSDPEILRGILQTHMTIFKKDLAWTYKPFMDILGNGLVTSDGQSWRRQRVLLSNYLRVEILDEIPGMAFRAVQRLGVKLDAAAASGDTVEMAEEFRTLTLQVIAEALLSLDPKESDETFAHMYLPIVEEGNLRTWNPTRIYNIFLPAFWKHIFAVKKLNDYVTGLIVKRRELRKMETEASTRKKDVLDKILGAIKDEDWAADTSTIISQIRDEIKTFVLAGHETSASMLAWSLYELNNPKNQPKRGKTFKVIYEGGCYIRSAPDLSDDRNRLQLLAVGYLVQIDGRVEGNTPGEAFYKLSDGKGYIRAKKNNEDVLQEVAGEESSQPLDRVLAEADRVFEGHMDEKGYVTSMPSRNILAGEREAKSNEYRGLDYTECCLRESLRKYSVVPTVVRNVSEDVFVGPYYFPKGMKVMVNMQGAHHTEENWPEADCYRPTRFLGDNLDKIKPYTFIPFIDGPRNCLGQFLSLLESKCVLAILSKRYTFELTNPDTAGQKHPFMVPIIPGPGHHFRIHHR